VKITDKRAKKYCRVRGINAGVCFLWGNRLFIKTNAQRSSGVELATGEITDFSTCDDDIETVDVEAIYK